jgi:hypothetical protein
MSAPTTHEPLETLLARLEAVDDALIAGAPASRALSDLVAELRDFVVETSFEDADPYLVVALQRAVIDMARRLDDGCEDVGEVRVLLETVRQSLRDIADELPVGPDRSGKELARWLVATLDVRQQEIAELLGVSHRSFQRWISETEAAEPEGDDAMRLQIAARIANHLRHALTGHGVILWFTTPHPRIGHAPAELLQKPEAFPELQRLASAARTSRAS